MTFTRTFCGYTQTPTHTRTRTYLLYLINLLFNLILAVFNFEARSMVIDVFHLRKEFSGLKERNDCVWAAE